MIKKKYLILINLIIVYICVFNLFPNGFKKLNMYKLLWKKNFDINISEFKVANNGIRIAVILEPILLSEIKDKNFYWSKNKKYESGKLIYLNRKGNILWKYTYRGKTKKYRFNEKLNKDELIETKGEYKFTNIQISDNGNSILCNLSEFITYGKENVQEWFITKTLYFNENGLQWETDSSEKSTMSSDGRYISIQISSNYKILSWEKEKLWEVTTGGNIEWSQPPEILAYIAENEEYIVIGDTLYDLKGEMLWEIPGIVFDYISWNGTIGIAKTKSTWNKLYCLNLKNKKHLWEKDANFRKNKFISDVIANKNYLITENEDLLIVASKNIIKVIDIKNGEILAEKKLENGYIQNIKNINEYRIYFELNEKEYFFDVANIKVNKNININEFMGSFLVGNKFQIIPTEKVIVSYKKNKIFYHKISK